MQGCPGGEEGEVKLHGSSRQCSARWVSLAQGAMKKLLYFKIISKILFGYNVENCFFLSKINKGMKNM